MTFSKMNVIYRLARLLPNETTLFKYCIMTKFYVFCDPSGDFAFFSHVDSDCNSTVLSLHEMYQLIASFTWTEHSNVI